MLLVVTSINHLRHYMYNKYTKFNLNYPWIPYSFVFHGNEPNIFKVPLKFFDVIYFVSHINILIFMNHDIFTSAGNSDSNFPLRRISSAYIELA